jgi:hypothetical protein
MYTAKIVFFDHTVSAISFKKRFQRSLLKNVLHGHASTIEIVGASTLVPLDKELMAGADRGTHDMIFEKSSTKKWLAAVVIVSD